MATLSGEYTLLDLKQGHDPKGNVAKIIDVLSEVNGVMSDAIWMEANDLTSHVVTQAFSEGAGSSGIINKTVAFEEDRTKQIRESMEMFESYSRIDERLIRRARSPEQFRAQRNAMRVRGMGKSWHTRFFYGTEADGPENVNGLTTRYNALSMSNVYDNGDNTADEQTSIWVVQWGQEGCHLIYPRGDKTVIEEKDLGVQLITDSDGAYTALVSHYMINWGLVVADDRSVQRIANVATTGSTNTFDDDLLIGAINELPDPGQLDRVRIYVNRTVKTQMDIALKDKNNVNYGITNAFGGPGGMLTFKGIPVRMVDRIVNTEAVVS
jgi:hypothetical protein